MTNVGQNLDICPKFVKILSDPTFYRSTVFTSEVADPGHCSGGESGPVSVVMAEVTTPSVVSHPEEENSTVVGGSIVVAFMMGSFLPIRPLFVERRAGD